MNLCDSFKDNIFSAGNPEVVYEKRGCLRRGRPFSNLPFAENGIYLVAPTGFEPVF